MAIPHVNALDLITDIWANALTDAVNALTTGPIIGTEAQRLAYVNMTPGLQFFATDTNRLWVYTNAWVLIAGSMPRFRLNRSAAVQTTNGVPLAIPWTVEAFDTDAIHVANAANIVVPPAFAGRWRFEYAVGYDPNATGGRSAWLDVGAVRYGSVDQYNLGAGASVTLSASVEVICPASQSVTLTAYQTSGANINIITHATNQYFQGQYVGPV
jgi:hypothetical protein